MNGFNAGAAALKRNHFRNATVRHTLSASCAI